jgi:hypothetical protein
LAFAYPIATANHTLALGIILGAGKQREPSDDNHKGSLSARGAEFQVLKIRYGNAGGSVNRIDAYLLWAKMPRRGPILLAGGRADKVACHRLYACALPTARQARSC